MKPAGHLAGAYLVSSALVRHLTPQSGRERTRLLVLGLLAGILPDLDFLLYVLKKRSLGLEDDFRHHTWVTHTFAFYWLPALIWGLWAKGRHKKSRQRQAAVFALATTTHLLQDMPGSGDGIMLFYPFSRKMYGVGRVNRFGSEWQKAYEKTPYYQIERLTIVLAAIHILWSLLGQKKQIRKL